MARARNIKPGLFKNEVLGVADPLYTLLFEGLWLLADREGRLEDRPVRIKGELFPYRDGIAMDAMLSWLESAGFIRRYHANGLALIQILQFTKHQSPHKNEAPSELPAFVGIPSEEIGTTRADSGFRIPDSLTADTQSSAAPPPPASKKTPIPADFGISERVRKWAAEKQYGQLEQHLDAYIRKCQANAYRKADWDASFMEAIREDWAKLRPKTRDGSAPPAETRHYDTAEETARRFKADERNVTGVPAAVRDFAQQIKRVA